MTVVGLIAISLTPLLHRIASPQTSTDDLLSADIINSGLMTGSALAACFLAGLMAWRPPRLQQVALDRIWPIVFTICLSFWLSGLIFGIAFALWSKTPNSILEGFGNYLAQPLFFSMGSGIAGPLLFGPIAYIVGFAMLWPLRRWATPEPSSSDWDTANNARRLLTVFSAALSLLSVYLAAASFLHLSYSLIVAGVASLEGKI